MAAVDVDVSMVLEDEPLGAGASYLWGRGRLVPNCAFDAFPSVSMRHDAEVRSHTVANSNHMVTFLLEPCVSSRHVALFGSM